MPQQTHTSPPACPPFAQLLASCAAAEAVSTPPETADALPGRSVRRPSPLPAEGTPRSEHVPGRTDTATPDAA
ncbi:hypothetical protein [Streptomyces sparsus]